MSSNGAISDGSRFRGPSGRLGRRHLVVCSTRGTFHIQPLDNPAARVSVSLARGQYKKGTQIIAFPKHIRHIDDAAGMARIICGDMAIDFAPPGDLTVQETLLTACGPTPKD